MTLPSPPQPTRRPVTRFSPTLLEAIDTCKLQAAFSLDPAFRDLRRPTPAGLLGQAAHRLLEDAAKGRFSSIPSGQLEEVLQTAWDDEMRVAAARLAAGRLAPPPPPPEWPGYELTRVRLLRRLARQLQQPRAARRGVATVTAERPLEDPATGLHGRPDRIEQASRHLRVVDTKTGLGQTDMRPAQRRQLLLYAYLVHQQFGRWPDEIAIEDVAGRRIVEPVQPAEVEAVVQEAVAAVHEFNDSLLCGSSIANIASPSAGACRQCPFRAACGPFWQELDQDWQLLACLAGLVQEIHKYPRRLVLRVEAPKWIAGRRVSVLGFSGVTEEAQIVGVVDAIPAGIDQVRIRWYTQLVPWRDSTTASPSRIS